MAQYSLPDKDYAETSEYLIIEDQIGGKGISYDLSNATAKSPVAIEGEHLKFALPQPFEKALDMRVEIDGHTLIARAKGYFTDYGEKVS